MAWQTIWMGGNGQNFVLRCLEVEKAQHELGQWVALSWLGKSAPWLFPLKSAWAFVTRGEAEAQCIWQGTDRVRGESQDPYWRVVARGQIDSLDTAFFALAHDMFSPLQAHLEAIQMDEKEDA
jgi:exonuclease V gamma subunit